MEAKRKRGEEAAVNNVRWLVADGDDWKSHDLADIIEQYYLLYLNGSGAQFELTEDKIELAFSKGGGKIVEGGKIKELKRQVGDQKNVKKARIEKDNETTDVPEEEDDAFFWELIQQQEKEEKERKEKEKEKGEEERKKKREFVFEERKGDLFTAGQEFALAHCVSEDLVMGKGIAKPFKEKFGGVAELKKQNPKTGGVCMLQRGGKWIYYLITKVVYKYKPTYNALRSSLQAMKAHMVKHGVTALAMPRIGCGLDGLVWEKVKPMIEEVFSDTPIHIRIYSL